MGRNLRNNPGQLEFMCSLWPIILSLKKFSA